MSLLLDALKKAEREKSQHPTWAPPADNARPVMPDLPMLSDGVYLAPGDAANDDGEAGGGQAPPVHSANIADPSAVDPYQSDGLWRLYLALASILLVILLVGTYGYFQYARSQHAASLRIAGLNKQIAISHRRDLLAGAEEASVAPAVRWTVPGLKAATAPAETRAGAPSVALSSLQKPTPAALPTAAPVEADAAVPPSATAGAPATAASVDASAVANAGDTAPPPAVIKKDSDPLAPLLRRAYAAYVQRDFTSAVGAYEEALRAQPQQRDALLGLAVIAGEQGDAERASEYYRQILRADSGDVIALTGLVATLQQKDPQAALRLLNDAITRDGGSAALYFALGALHMSQGQWAQAKGALSEAVRRDGNNADYIYNLGVANDRLGERSAALRAYRRALQVAADRGNAGFRRDPVERRIAQLTTAE